MFFENFHSLDWNLLILKTLNFLLNFGQYLSSIGLKLYTCVVCVPVGKVKSNGCIYIIIIMHCWVGIRKGGALLSVPFGVEMMSLKSHSPLIILGATG